jgi:hypothetical protein
LFGAVVGVVTAFGVQFLQQRSADRHRFSERKLERYAEFLRGLDEQSRAVRHQRAVIAALGRLPLSTDAIPEIPRHELLKLLAQEIKILARGDSEVGYAADQALAALQDLRAYRYDAAAPPPYLHAAPSLDGYESAVATMTASMKGFTEAARTDLGTG